MTIEAPPAVPGAAATFRTAAEIKEKHSDRAIDQLLPAQACQPTWCFGCSSQWASRYGGGWGGHQCDRLISWCHGCGGGALWRAGCRCGGCNRAGSGSGGSSCRGNVVLLHLEEVSVGRLRRPPAHLQRRRVGPDQLNPSGSAGTLWGQTDEAGDTICLLKQKSQRQEADSSPVSRYQRSLQHTWLFQAFLYPSLPLQM